MKGRRSGADVLEGGNLSFERNIHSLETSSLVTAA